MGWEGDAPADRSEAGEQAAQEDEKDALRQS